MQVVNATPQTPTSQTATSAAPTRPSRFSFNTTYYLMELRRIGRDRVGLFFTVGLPGFMYLIFGASPDYGSEPVRDGNVAMWVMIAMAAYGAVTATNGVGGSAAIERMQGWTRQLGLTPMHPVEFIAVKAAAATTVAGGTIALIFILGAFTGAQAPLSVWVISGLLLLAGSVTFSLFGLCFGLAVRSEAAVSASGGALVILSFLGNIFIPLSGWQLALAKFTPLYGYVALARRPLTGGANLDSETGELIAEPLLPVLANVGFWTAALCVLTLVLVKRSRGRQ